MEVWFEIIWINVAKMQGLDNRVSLDWGGKEMRRLKMKSGLRGRGKKAMFPFKHIKLGSFDAGGSL